MSDQRLRERERRRGGTVDDEAAWLVERLRTGSLTRERLDLAAWCGHEAAIRAGGTAGATEAEAWVRGLEPLSRGLAVWALAEALALERLASEASAPRMERVRAGARAAFLASAEVRFAEQEIEDPRSEEEVAIDTLLQVLRRVARDARRVEPTDPDVGRALASVRPRFPYLDPGEWKYAHSERSVRAARHPPGWEHHLLYVRVRGGESTQVVLAAPGWEPPPHAPPALSVLAGAGFDAVRWPPAVVRETAIEWALR